MVAAVEEFLFAGSSGHCAFSVRCVGSLPCFARMWLAKLLAAGKNTPSRNAYRIGPPADVNRRLKGWVGDCPDVVQVARPRTVRQRSLPVRQRDLPMRAGLAA